MDSIWAIETDHRNPKTGTPWGCIFRSNFSGDTFLGLTRRPGGYSVCSNRLSRGGDEQKHIQCLPSLLKYTRILDTPPASNKLPSHSSKSTTSTFAFTCSSENRSQLFLSWLLRCVLLFTPRYVGVIRSSHQGAVGDPGCVIPRWKNTMPPLVVSTLPVGSNWIDSTNWVIYSSSHESWFRRKWGPGRCGKLSHFGPWNKSFNFTFPTKLCNPQKCKG